MTAKESQAELLERIRAAIERGIQSARTVAPNVKDTRTAGPLRHLAQLAHELKTPLSAIVAAAEVMRDERLGPIGTPLYRGYAADIHESASHALEVIAAMLAPEAQASRGGREAPVYVELDVNELVRRLASSVRALLAAAGIEIDVDLDAAPPNLVADPVTMRQLLLNLVTNAMRATPRGGRIVISTRQQPSGALDVAIEDTGSGMAKDEFAVLLDPSRSPPGAKAEGEGFGLGYPLMLELAAVNGATLSIASEPGRGTIVRVSFPADRLIAV